MEDDTVVSLNCLDNLVRWNSKIDKNLIDEIQNFDIMHHGHKIRELRWVTVSVTVK
jgi:hypothetical protein